MLDGSSPAAMTTIGNRKLVSLETGRTNEFGAIWDGAGTNFAVCSSVATAIDLCLFHRGGGERRFPLQQRSADTWSGYAPGIGPGQQYGFRVHGPMAPHEGHRCDPSIVLVDPYARALVNTMFCDEAAPPRSIVVDPRFNWGDDLRPARPWRETVLYEMHVKSFTRRLRALEPRLRGTFAGLASEASIDHLLGLGVTAVELMPVHAFLHDNMVTGRGLRNFWGYSTLGFFAPHSEYAVKPLDAVAEFKRMVRALHAAGLEVILDVVYNHTTEGNHLGPTVCLKGLDNAGYYRLVEHDRSLYFDCTGTGNSLDLRHPQALRLVLDSLRYWVTDMHVDGFRFDLAATLGRTAHDFDPTAVFFGAIAQDPVLRQVKMIAEPWDLCTGGYQLGNFPRGWAEWNDRYRDTVRDFWRSADGALPDFATRVSGSRDVFGDVRGPLASINFVTSHDGFTLTDLVSYNDKHNEANGEQNRDGTSDNRSWNLGAEGPTSDAAILARRARQRRNFLATLLLSQGVPMLLSGDELGRTQGGNNNAYCQDNDTSWIDWDRADQGLADFVHGLIQFRAQHALAFNPSEFCAASTSACPAIEWFHPRGTPMTADDWANPELKAVCLRVEDVCMVFNASLEAGEFVLPPCPTGDAWRAAVDTAGIDHPLTPRSPGEILTRPDLSLWVGTCARQEGVWHAQPMGRSPRGR